MQIKSITPISPVSTTPVSTEQKVQKEAIQPESSREGVVSVTDASSVERVSAASETSNQMDERRRKLSESKVRVREEAAQIKERDRIARKDADLATESKDKNRQRMEELRISLQQANSKNTNIREDEIVLREVQEEQKTPVPERNAARRQVDQAREQQREDVQVGGLNTPKESSGTLRTPAESSEVRLAAAQEAKKEETANLDVDKKDSIKVAERAADIHATSKELTKDQGDEVQFERAVQQRTRIERPDDERQTDNAKPNTDILDDMA